MSEKFVTCTYCHKRFPLSEAIIHEMEEKVKTDHQFHSERLEQEHQKEIEKIDVKIRQKENQIILDNLRKPS